MELHRFRDTMLQPVRRLYAMQGMSIVEFMIAITGRQHLIFDADDTLWENNIYFEQAFEEFCEYLNHSSLTPPEIRDILDADIFSIRSS